MKKFMSYDGTLMGIFTKIMYIAAANFLFIICCIPIITAGASACAMYTLLMQYKKGDEPDIPMSLS